MAITKTVFTATNITNSLTEIAEWLTANAAALGFTVSTETDGNVICTNAKGTNFLKFCPNNADKVGIVITLDNGKTRDSTAGNSFPAVWSSGYVSRDGLALFASDSDSHLWVFIGKTSNGGLYVFHQIAYGTITLIYGDVDKGVKIISSYAANVASSPEKFFYILTNGKKSDRTSFAPICFDSGDTAATLFFTPQTQYPMTDFGTGREMVFSADGEEFVYSGIVAMKG